MDHRPAVRGQGQRRYHTTLPRTTVGVDFVVAITDSSLAWARCRRSRARPARQASIAPVTPAADVRRPSARRDDGSATSPEQLRPRRLEQQPHADQRPRHPARSPAETASLTIGRKLVVYRSDAPIAATSPRSAVTGDTLRLRDGHSRLGRLRALEPADRRQRRPGEPQASVRAEKVLGSGTPRCRASASCSHSRRSRSSRIRSSRAACAPTSTSLVDGGSGSRSERCATSAPPTRSTP